MTFSIRVTPPNLPLSQGEEPTVHVPVLLAECMAGLAVRAGGIYIDATGGGGGHASAIWRACQPHGQVVVLDQDEAAIARLTQRFGEEGVKAKCVHGNFRDAAALLPELAGKVDGILADLGLSSDQLDTAGRGFSFLHSGPLDMRMNRSAERTALEIINEWPETELATIFFEYGEEHRSRRIAKAVIEERKGHPIETTEALAALIARVCGRLYRQPSRRHPATRSFQALRIAVNDELGALRALLHDVAPALLHPGGRLAVISFHSLEDRLVKQAFKEPPWTALTRKPIAAAVEEQRQNPRSRSAKLRIAKWRTI